MLGSSAPSGGREQATWPSNSPPGFTPDRHMTVRMPAHRHSTCMRPVPSLQIAPQWGCWPRVRAEPHAQSQGKRRGLPPPTRRTDYWGTPGDERRASAGKQTKCWRPASCTLQRNDGMHSALMPARDKAWPPNRTNTNCCIKFHGSSAGAEPQQFQSVAVLARLHHAPAVMIYPN